MKAIKSDSDSDSNEQKKVAKFFRKKNRGVTPSVVTHPSDATEFRETSGVIARPLVSVRYEN